MGLFGRDMVAPIVNMLPRKLGDCVGGHTCTHTHTQVSEDVDECAENMSGVWVVATLRMIDAPDMEPYYGW